MRLLRWLLSAYLAAAAVTRLAEFAGLRHCECSDECWCKRPVLGAFRWVFPRWHRW